MYVGIFFSLSTLVRLVRPCSMHVGILFGWSFIPFSSACMHGFLQLYHRAQHVKKTADITLKHSVTKGIKQALFTPNLLDQ